MAGGIILPDFVGKVPESTVPPTFAGIIRNVQHGQSVITAPPRASGGSRPTFAGIPARGASLPPVGLPAGAGRLPRGIARAREVGGKAVARGLALARRVTGR